MHVSLVHVVLLVILNDLRNLRTYDRLVAIRPPSGRLVDATMPPPGAARRGWPGHVLLRGAKKVRILWRTLVTSWCPRSTKLKH